MERIQQQQLEQAINSNKITLVSGPRSSGKEEMILQTVERLKETVLTIEAGEKKIRKELEKMNLAEVIESFNDFGMVVIFEAQYLSFLQPLIEAILTDQLKASLVLSCSFDPEIDEIVLDVLNAQGALLKVYPPCFYELAQSNGLPNEEKLLEQRMVYGNYPEVIENLENAESTLNEIIDQIIVSNLGVNDRINKHDKLIRMLQFIAFRIGEPISYNEIGERCGLDNETVERYVKLLEKSFVLVALPTLFSDKRYELKKTHVIYFTDTGIRNVLINNFNSPDWRNDMEQLWKNWLIVERIKWNAINQKEASYKFWRTHTKQTMDFIEEGATIAAYKITWLKKKVKLPAMFQEYYPNYSNHTLNRSTYWSFLTKK